MTKLLFTMLVALCPAAAFAETFHLMNDTHDLQPPYWQDWNATTTGRGSFGMPGTHEVYIRGHGKHGDFYGVLLVDCANPQDSEWLATGGFVSADRVPAKAIATLRLKICREGQGA